MSYTAAVLSTSSRAIVMERVGDLVPEGWEIVNHHCTCHMGPPIATDRLGETAYLVADAYAMDDRVIAIRIANAGEISKNETPHVTVAVNRKDGAKPFESNNLKKWIEFPAGQHLVLITYIQECH